MNLFIDTNVLLSFYRYVKADLDQLTKLAALMSTDKVTLWMPEQVKDEWHRNRESVIQKSISELEKQRYNWSFPTICKNYSQYEELQRLQDGAKANLKALISSIKQDAVEQSLEADRAIRELLRVSRAIRTSQDIIKRAEHRRLVGNPPGKADSVGDQINWESLLDAVTEEEDIYFVSNDGDFASPLNRDELNVFLVDEWERKNDSEIHFHKSLSFLSEEFPQIKLPSSTELEKDILVQDLADSGSFSTTHKLIAKLRSKGIFSEAQLDTLISAAVNNNQIRHILDDPDVRRFFIRLIETQEFSEDSEIVEELKDLMKLDH